MNSKIKKFPKPEMEEVKEKPKPKKVEDSDVKKLMPEELEKFQKHAAMTKELYAEMGRLESAKLDLYGNIQQLSRNYNTMVDELFSRLKCDPKKRYDLNIETGVIKEM